MNSNAVALGKIEIMDRTTVTSQRRNARIAGILYLIIIAAGIFAEFFVRSSLIVPGDAAATATNIMASEGLFRIGIVSDLVMILSDVAIGLIFYILLKPVNKSLALLAAFFRLAQAATLGINLLNLFFVLQLLSGAEYLAILETGQLQALAMLFFEAHGIGYSIAMVFFGLSILVLGYLLFKSGYFPRILGVLLVLASIGYLIDSFASFLMSNYVNYAAIFNLIVPLAFFSELALCLWLLLKGVNVQTQDKRAFESAGR